MTRVSVIIPVYNDADRLAQCLARLAEQSMPGDDFEVIVVDNGSDDPPRAVVEQHPFCQFTAEAKPGSYAARNHAVRIASGDTLAFTDADCLPQPDWLEQGVAAIEQGAAVVGGAVEMFSQDPQSPTSVELYDMAFGLDQPTNISKLGYSVTANLFTTRTVFEEVGEFNSDVLSGGDAEWCERAASNGHPVAYCPAAVVRHPARATLKSVVKQARRHMGGRMDRNNRPSPFSLHYWWVVGRILCPNVAKMLLCRRRLAELGFGLGAWLRTAPIVLVVQYTRLLELLRKRLGFSSERT